jgi:nucleotide-binding universal stress UspA family protein
MDRIVVATNLSSNSQTMLSYARVLARRFSAAVDVLHVIDLTLPARAVDGISAPAMDSILRQNRELLCEAAQSMPGIKAECVEVNGWDRPQAILDYAKRVDAGLLVMGTVAKQGLTRLVFGSTAEKVFRQARCPVLTVGPKVLPLHEEATLQSIIYVADFSPESARAAGIALAFAEDQGARLYVCHVVREKGHALTKTDEEWSKELSKMIPESAYEWCSPSCVVEHGDAAQTILKLADKVAADLIVLGSRKERPGVMYIQAGLTPTLLAKAKCPVLTIS